jgi:hypothetical protein
MNDRMIRPELLDSAGTEAAEASVRDLARCNRWLGGHAVRHSVFRTVAGPRERFSVLDIGSASGDAGRSLLRKFPLCSVTSLDYRLVHLSGARAPRIAADAFHLPFRERSFDFVHSSLFLHHFSEPRIVELLTAMRRIARRNVIIIDLYRHSAPYYFLSASRPFFRWHEISMIDGRTSFDAAFRPAELERLARASGAPQFRLRTHWPWFRISLVLET